MEKSILNEQIAYYRARAQEYDESLSEISHFLSQEKETSEPEGALAQGMRLLQQMGPFEHVLELACGTGIWTRVLLTIGQEVTAIDAAPEMLSIAQSKLGDVPVHFQQADLFSWEPMQTYDLVFFAFWLSHVPPATLDPFLDKVRRAVGPRGHLVIVDEHAPTDEDRLLSKEGIYATRPLKDGRTFTIVKVFYNLTILQEKLTHLGFEVEIHKLSDIFFFLSGTRH
jgi:demethylmenaquinone methyltransferase/2-methoxy-6-polyprenyl-1,4-benzoquinol methylase